MVTRFCPHFAGVCIALDIPMLLILKKEDLFLETTRLLSTSHGLNSRNRLYVGRICC